MQIETTLRTDPRANDASVNVHVDRARRALEAGKPERAAREFETLLAVQLVRELRRSLPQPLFGEGSGADIYEGWFDEHLGRSLAERDALGLAKVIQGSLARKAVADAASDSPEVGP